MFEVSRFVESCRQATNTGDPAQTVHAIMTRIIPDTAAIEAALGRVELQDATSAQYRFLHQSPELTVMHVTMPGHLQSPPHNHLVWAVIGIYRGRENNVFYRREHDAIAETGRRNLAAPEVMTLAPDVIHGIANPLPVPSCALHVYGGSLANPLRSLWNPFTFQEEPFQISALSRYESEMTRVNPRS